ncbi:HEAT repeat domain-containing protein [Paraflavitalea pollutisoli]|uniref:HEAT repeat domain-containing protein n=1 Tax=Paraflavitalea pollutisoli TaxID=3034143 RepID=UPI0023EC0E5E|nr:hypothetical protein [Paraflavitalea sp. H1-2-19X]
MKNILTIAMMCLFLQQVASARQNNVTQGEVISSLHDWGTYRVRFSTHVSTDFASLGTRGQDTSLTGNLLGTMRTECVGRSLTKQYMYACFLSIDQCRFPLPLSVQQSIQSLLGKGFYFSRTRQGLIDSVWLPGAITEAAEHVVIQLLEPFQWSLPASTRGEEPPVMTLSDGAVRAIFTKADTGACAKALQLDSLDWIPPVGQSGVLARRIEYQVGTRYCFDKEQVRSIEGQFIRKAKVNHKTITVLTNKYQYVLLTAGSDGHQSEARHISGYRRPLYYPGLLEQKLREQQLVRSQRMSVSGLLRLLKENELLQDVNRQDQLAEAVKICFIASKDSLTLFSAVFYAAPVNSITFKTLRTGIVTASTPYAQQVLRDFILLNRDSAEKLKKIIPSSGLVRNAQRMLQQQLETLAFDTANNESIVAASMLALGNIAGSIRTDDPKRSDSLTDYLGKVLRARGDDMLLLSVMGNCGTAVALPFILPLLTDADTTVRAYAYYALRFVQQPLVDATYAEALTAEQHPAILTNIFNALFLRTGNDILKGALLRLVEKANEPVRLEALQVLFEWSYREPALLTVFREVATSNSSEAVKKAARQFLARADE